MDEHSFDGFLKQRLENYEDPSSEDEGLKQFQSRMASLRRKKWYSYYRTEITVVSGLVLFTLLNTYITRSLVTTSKPVADKAQIMQTSYGAKIDSLQNIIEHLRESNIALLNKNATSQLARSEEKALAESKAISTYHIRPEINSNDSVLLESFYQIPYPLRKTLQQYNVIALKGGNAFWVKGAVSEKNLLASPVETSVDIITKRISPIAVGAVKAETDIHKKDLSAKTKNALAKHYFQGLGIHLAPHAGLMINSFEESDVTVTPRIGISADWKFSPHWSIETSIDYGNNKFHLTDHFQKYHLEDYDPGNIPEKVTVSTRSMMFPVAIKYSQWISPRNEFVLRGIYTPYFGIHQQFIYTYNTQGYGDDYAAVNTIKTKDFGKLYGSTVGLSVGLQHLLKKNAMEVALFYEHSVGDMKPQQNNMQLFGVSAAYWMRVK